MLDLSIITVCYNNRDGLEKTILSIITQTYKNYEFIIIDGGSTDGSQEVIEKYRDSINYSVSEKDNGIYHAMNKGIMKASGTYCIFMNSGDFFADEYVLGKIFSSNLSSDIVYGDVIRVKSWWNKRVLHYPEKLTHYDFYKRTAAIHHQASFIKKELFNKYGSYREDVKLIGDWLFFFTAIIINQCTTQHVKIIVAIVNAGGISHIHQADDPAILRDQEIRSDLIRTNIPDYIVSDYENQIMLMTRKSDKIKKHILKIVSEKTAINRILRSIYVKLIRF
jgi:glycosyltransferase involved in cell wall biosynthesis